MNQAQSKTNPTSFDQDQHTPEPWRYVRANPSPTTGEHMIAGASPGYLAEVRDCGSGDVRANARRIVACVNACAGVPNDVLEQAGNGGPDVKEWFQGWGEKYALEAQRDELVAVLRDCEHVLDGPVAALLTTDSMVDSGAYDMLVTIRAVLAKVSK